MVGATSPRTARPSSRTSKASPPAERYAGDEEFADARVRIPPTKGLLHGPDGAATYADRRLDQPQSIYRPDIAAG
ncbi:MAG TPA: hypothetical protein VJ482_00735 [Acidimicrobiia bacterium]|nr:hypothetical protein [Acidimicrobiia bacterium]